MKKLLLSFFALLSISAQAATITVDSTADPAAMANDGNCTLREAIAAANTNTAVDACGAGNAGADTIAFDASIAGGTITLGGSEIVISEALTINGSSSGMTLDANHASRIFSVSAPLSIDRLNVINGHGYTGGAIYTTANLTVTNSTLSGNRAYDGGAIYAYAYYAYAEVTLTNSTLSGNRAYDGGAIYANANNGDAEVTLTNSTLSGNRADDDGGAIYAYANGYVYAEVTLTNSTLSGNRATNGGAIYAHADAGANANVRLTSSTLSGNTATNGGGAILVYATATAKLTLTSSLLVGNLQGTIGNHCDLNGNATVDTANSAHNLLDVACGGMPATTPAVALADVLQTYDDNGTLKPLLADHGCATAMATGCVKTIALQPSTAALTNPAIDTGAANAPTTDQRGFARVGAADIGAFEYAGMPPVTLTVTPPANGAISATTPASGGAINTCSATHAAACSAVYATGTAVDLTVTPDAGYEIAGVSGCGGTLNGSTFTTAVLTADCTVSAAFAAIDLPTGNAQQVYTGSKTLADLAISGTSLRWYDTGGAVLADSTALVDGSRYHVTQTLNGRESLPLAVTVTRLADDRQTLCGSAFTVADLTATPAAGADVAWFASATGGTALAGSTALSSGRYYAEQTMPAVMTTLATGGGFPFSLALAADGKILVSYSGENTIRRFDADGSNGVTVRDSGLNQPFGLAVQTDGKIIIADMLNHAIKRMDADGSNLVTLLDSGLNRPYGVALQADGKILIVDTDNHAIKRMDADGSHVVTLLDSGLKNPYSVAVQADGKILIADRGNNAIKRMDADGRNLVTLLDSGLNAPRGIVVQADGKIVFVDSFNNAIKRMNADGSQVETLVSTGLNFPYDVALRADGSFVLTDVFNTAVKHYQAANTSNRVAVDVVVSSLPPTPTVTTPVMYTEGDSATALSINNLQSDAATLWYSSASGGTASTTAPVPDTSVVGNVSYWVSQQSPCGESARVEIIVEVTEKTVTVGGTVSGLSAGESVVLRKTINSSPLVELLTVSTNSVFTFSQNVMQNDLYTVTIEQTPAGKACTLSASASGTAGAVDITDIVVNCSSNSYTITTTVIPTAGGTLSCTPNPVAYGGNSTCTATAHAGYTLVDFAGDCTGTTCELTNVTTNKAVTANFTKNGVKSLPFTGLNGTGQGSLSIAGGGNRCTLNTVRIATVSELNGSPSPPEGMTFKQGLVEFSAANCAVGATLTVTIEYPETITSGATLMKWGRTAAQPQNHWYELPATISGNSVSYRVIDGGAGDDDLVANGAIIDPAGTASPGNTVNAAARPVPTLSRNLLLLLLALLAGMGAYRYRLIT